MNKNGEKNKNNNITTRSSNQNAIELMMLAKKILTHLALSWKIIIKKQQQQKFAHFIRKKAEKNKRIVLVM